jgi:glucokinase
VAVTAPCLDAAVAVGVDIGGTTTSAAVFDAADHLLALVERPTDASAPDAIVAGTLAVVRDALAQAGARPLELVGVGIPGQVDAASGEVRFAVNLALGPHPLPLGAALAGALGSPCIVENDARAGAMGAFQALRSQGPVDHVAYLSIGTGVSAGVVLAGRLHRGASGMAGEIGHLVVDPSGVTCRCGLRGCLEAVVAGPALARTWPHADPRVAARSLFESAARADADAIAIVAVVARHLAWAVHWLAMAYDVDRIVLGGGVGNVGDPLLRAVEVELRVLREASPLVAELVPPGRVTTLPTGSHAAVRGAVAVARDRLRAGAG